MAANDNARSDARHVQRNIRERLQFEIARQLHCLIACPNHMMADKVSQSSRVRFGKQYAIEQKGRAFVGQGFV